MPKQCPECASITQNDLGYCPSCACKLHAEPSTRTGKVWQFLAVFVAGISAAGAAIFYFWRDNGR